MSDTGISVIIPVYNEEKSVTETIKHIQKVMDGTKRPYEIIAVNDCSKDKTGEILAKIDGIKVITHQVNKGYGASLKDAIRAAVHETLVMIDADGTYPPDAIPSLLEKADGHVLVSGNRHGATRQVPLMRRPAKFILAQLANFLVGQKIQDLNCGLRVIKKENVMKYFSILPNRFSFTTTHVLSCIADGLPICFVKINYYKRAGISTIHPIKDFLRFIHIIFKEGLLINPLKFFGTISVFLTMLAIGVFCYSYYVLALVMDITTVILLMGAIQVFLFGLLADLILRKRN